MNLRSVRHPPPLFVVVVLVIGNIDITFKSNSVLKITDARRLSHKLGCARLISLVFIFFASEKVLFLVFKTYNL